MISGKKAATVEQGSEALPKLPTPFIVRERIDPPHIVTLVQRAGSLRGQAIAKQNLINAANESISDPVARLVDGEEAETALLAPPLVDISKLQKEVDVLEEAASVIHQKIFAERNQNNEAHFLQVNLDRRPILVANLEAFERCLPLAELNQQMNMACRDAGLPYGEKTMNERAWLREGAIYMIGQYIKELKSAITAIDAANAEPVTV